MTALKPFEPQIYAVLRIIAGLMFLCHGTQKLFGWPVEAMAGMPPMVQYLGGGIEFGGGLLIAIGLFTRWAAFLASGMMAAAYWMAHGLKAFFPIANGGETGDPLLLPVPVHLRARTRHLERRRIARGLICQGRLRP